MTLRMESKILSREKAANTDSQYNNQTAKCSLLTKITQSPTQKLCNMHNDTPYNQNNTIQNIIMMLYIL